MKHARGFFGRIHNGLSVAWQAMSTTWKHQSLLLYTILPVIIIIICIYIVFSIGLQGYNMQLLLQEAWDNGTISSSFQDTAIAVILNHIFNAIKMGIAGILTVCIIGFALIWFIGFVTLFCLAAQINHGNHFLTHQRTSLRSNITSTFRKFWRPLIWWSLVILIGVISNFALPHAIQPIFNLVWTCLIMFALQAIVLSNAHSIIHIFKHSIKTFKLCWAELIGVVSLMLFFGLIVIGTILACSFIIVRLPINLDTAIGLLLLLAAIFALPTIWFMLMLTTTFAIARTMLYRRCI